MTTPLEKAFATIKERMEDMDTPDYGIKYALKVCEVALADQKKNFAMVDAEHFRYAIYNAYNAGHDAGLKRQLPNPILYFKNRFKKN
jgi:hypothetical protein